MLSKKNISLSLLLLLGNSYLSAMNTQMYTPIKQVGTKTQNNAMNFFQNLYTKITDKNSISSNNNSFTFLLKATVEIESNEHTNVVIITKNKKPYKNHFRVQHKEKNLIHEVNKNKIQNYNKINNHFNALQTLPNDLPWNKYPGVLVYEK